MGRSKSAPTQRLEEGSQQEPEVLGRLVNSVPLDALFAQEVDESESEEEEEEEEEDVLYDDSAERNGRETAACRLRERLQHLLNADGSARNQKKKKKPVCLDLADSSDEEEGKQGDVDTDIDVRPAPKKKQIQKKRRGKKRKKVQFAESENSQFEIPTPEVQICPHDDDDDDDDDDCETFIIVVAPQNIQGAGESSAGDLEQHQQRHVLLRSWSLTNCHLEYESNQDIALDDPRNINITSSEGALTILGKCMGTKDMPSSSVGEAVQCGTLRLELLLEEHQIQVQLFVSVQKAVDAGNPFILPMGHRRRKRSPGLSLQQAMTSLFPDVFQDDPQDIHTTITAKQVYGLVDNLQYHARQQIETTTEGPLGTIPGLVPTLRPYQRAAVEWMLQREQGSSASPNNEWELAWYFWNSSSKWVSLIEWNSVKDNDTGDVCLYCPIYGWWATSYQTAKQVTIGMLPSITKGGILAESMGLGKTVEVLACILANPAPILAPKDETSNSVVEKKKSQQTLRNSQKTANKTTVSNEGESEDEHTVDGTEVERNNSLTAGNPSHQTLMVTFQSEDDENEDYFIGLSFDQNEDYAYVEDRWLDSGESTLGVCMCGKVIRFGELSSVLMCGSCEKPMHARCANISDEKYQSCNRMVYRRQSFDDCMECRICDDEYCPWCIASRCGSSLPLIHSRATLIITPPAILNQWEREIARHTAIPRGSSDAGSSSGDTRPLKVVVYPGIRSKLIDPYYLADADIVLLTFDALKGDLNHSDDNPYVVGGSTGEARSSRSGRLSIVPSPLVSILWWRVCLDEAQRVETPTAASARMALKLHANFRWCVSGTPVGRGKLEDLYGLLLFLRLEPFSSKEWFAKCFGSNNSQVNNRIRHLLRNIFWRSTKASLTVKEQMGVPEQVEKKVILQFSSIERHFYQRQLEETMNIAGDVVDAEKAGKKRKISQLDNLSQQLHKLRAACCHPQVGSSGLGRIRKKRKVAGSKDQDESESNAFSRILTMDQILDRLIDDAKLKCEEAQRLALMHNNAMAALSKLKVEAKSRGVSVADSDTRLMAQSCKLYLDSLSVTEENSKPSYVVGEALMSGCMGFRSSQQFVRDGKALLDWQIKDFDDTEPGTARQLWARIDFEGPSKKITQIRARPVASLPQKLHLETSQSVSWTLLSPKECVFQVSSAAVGGEFVDVVSFELPPIDDSNARIEDWVLEGNFRTNRSKSWRLLVKSYHNEGLATNNQPIRALYCGVETEFYEADIAGDSLQRLHALHNASISFDALIIMQEGDTTDSDVVFLSGSEMKDRLREMQKEAKKIEALYIDGVLPLHQESQRQLQAALAEREKCEQDLFELTRKSNKNPGILSDCFDDGWWNDMLLICTKYGHPREQFELCKRVHEDLNSAMEGAYDRKELKLKPFPPFHDVTGLYHGVLLRMNDLRSGVPPGSIARCLEDFKKMSSSPTEKAILESSQCERCKRDWTWKGPMCAHCKLSVRFNKLVPDRLLLLVLGSINAWMKGGKASGPFASARTAANVDERAKKFFDVLLASKKEKSAAERAWRIHLDLLNDLDELNMCRRAIRLSLEGEDLTQLAEAELNAIVHPVDVASAYMDHGAKQAMALANLRRQKSTLRYLKNQNLERAKAPPGDTPQETSEEIETCVVCLSSFQTGRAVLSCGHSFHHSCMEKLIARPGNHQVISCPLRCTIRTKRDEVMIATDKRRDDGSAIDKRVEGSWGTKVTRLVADVLDVSNLGEKSIVFSMWEDMLDVVEEALTVNRIAYARATSVAKIADSTKRFRASDCSVLLLNVKNGAEGLTLLEATHIFMVEPLMNCGLDSQAISRIHRIGQTMKTHVHRYLIAETIEIKIDRLRMERQEDQLEDSINEVKRTTFKAGGIDGGFSSQEELLKVLQIT